VQVEPWFNLPHLIQVVSCCLFDLVTVVFKHYNYKIAYSNKKIVLLFWTILWQPLQTLLQKALYSNLRRCKPICN